MYLLYCWILDTPLHHLECDFYHIDTLSYRNQYWQSALLQLDYSSTTYYVQKTCLSIKSDLAEGRRLSHFRDLPVHAVHEAFADAALDRWEVAYARWAGGCTGLGCGGCGVAMSTEWRQRESGISRSSSNSNTAVAQGTTAAWARRLLLCRVEEGVKHEYVAWREQSSIPLYPTRIEGRESDCRVQKLNNTGAQRCCLRGPVITAATRLPGCGKTEISCADCHSPRLGQYLSRKKSYS